MRNAEHQSRNREWWTKNTMSYDWNEKIDSEKYTKDWFRKSDLRFLHGARLFTGAANPFEQLMDLPDIAGKRVLEIGCGMGFHSELLARAGGRLTSIDISPTSVEATKRRLSLAGIESDVREMDALEAGSLGETFDLIWSWGVLHHSSHTARAVRVCSSLLKPAGSLRLMVYHTGGMSAYVTFVRRYLSGFWRGRDIDELLWQDADGFTARFYTRDGFADMLGAFFNEVDVRVFGQDADVVPVPRQIRPPLLRLLSKEKQIKLAGERGSMIFADCRLPV